MILDNELFRDDLKRLCDITRLCRPDMHEPDEQGVRAEYGPRRVHLSYGKNDEHAHWYTPGLDNASTAPPAKNFTSDMGFWLTRENDDGTVTREWFNLADVIALARLAENIVIDQQLREAQGKKARRAKKVIR